MVSTKWTYCKEGVLPVTNFLFENFVSVQEPLVKSWFDVLTTQMPIFLIFVGAGVLFDGAFSMWVSLIKLGDVTDSHL